MTRTVITKFAVLSILALIALVSVQSAVAKSQPTAAVDKNGVAIWIPAPMKDFRYPGTVSGFERLSVSATAVDKNGVAIWIPAPMQDFRYPGTVTR